MRDVVTCMLKGSRLNEADRLGSQARSVMAIPVQSWTYLRTTSTSLHHQITKAVKQALGGNTRLTISINLRLLHPIVDHVIVQLSSPLSTAVHVHGHAVANHRCCRRRPFQPTRAWPSWRRRCSRGVGSRGTSSTNFLLATGEEGLKRNF